MIYPSKVEGRSKFHSRKIIIPRQLALKYNIEKGDILLLVDKGNSIELVSKKEYLK